MEPVLVGRGLLLGVSIAAAVGPVTLLVIRRTLGSGMAIGLASGLGVAAADATYAAIAAFGIGVAADLLVSLTIPLGVVGGCALVAVGARTVLRADAPLIGRPATARGLAGACASMVGLTLTNPLTVLLYGALVVSMGIPASMGAAASLWLGLAIGSIAWWLVLVPIVALVRGRLSPWALRVVTMASGIAIALFGVVALAGAIGAIA